MSTKCVRHLDDFLVDNALSGDKQKVKRDVMLRLWNNFYKVLLASMVKHVCSAMCLIWQRVVCFLEEAQYLYMIIFSYQLSTV